MAQGRLNTDKITTYIPGADVAPVCPHCENKIEGVYQQPLDESLGKAFMWFCTNCRKVLGISHRKGFWMG